MKQNRNAHGENSSSPKKVDRRMLVTLLLTAVLSMAVLAVYRVMLQYWYFSWVLGIYMAITVAALLGYLIYNRGMSRRGITADMLPDKWSREEKEEFIADGKRRLARSRWLLMVIFAFVFTFAVDAVELFVVPLFRGMIG